MSKIQSKGEIFWQKIMGPNKFILANSQMGIGMELEGFLRAIMSSVELFKQVIQQKRGQ